MSKQLLPGNGFKLKGPIMPNLAPNHTGDVVISSEEQLSL